MPGHALLMAMSAPRSPLLFAMVLGLTVAACPPGPREGRHGVTSGSDVALDGVDTSALTPRERREWRGYVDELLAPCRDVAVSIAECVADKRPCPACQPAALYLMHLVRSGRPKTQVLELFDARFDPAKVRTIVIGDSASRGPTNAPVTIVEFADFECPSCALMSEVLDTVVALHPDQIRFVYKHYPISYHPHAHLAARAAVAAQKQGKFWPMHRMCFDHADRLTEADLKRYAAEMGLDLARFEADLNAEHVHRQVDRERKQGDGLGVTGTPTLFINGRDVPLGALDDPVQDLKEWVDVELELVRAAARHATQ